MQLVPASVRHRVHGGGRIEMTLWEMAQIFGSKMSDGVEVAFMDFEIDFGTPDREGSTR